MTRFIAQALYETHKATTYPRSDSGYLPESMFAEVPTVLSSLVKTDPGLRPLIDRLDRSQRSRAWDDSKISAHHGIIPTLEPAKLSAMNDKELAVYRLIRAHYLTQFLPHHEYDRTKALLSANDETLQANGKQVVIVGWREALAQEADEEPARQGPVLPRLAEGMRCAIEAVELKALKTLPPKPYTQSELVKAMKGVARLVADPRLKKKENIGNFKNNGKEYRRKGHPDALDQAAHEIQHFSQANEAFLQTWKRGVGIVGPEWFGDGTREGWQRAASKWGLCPRVAEISEALGVLSSGERLFLAALVKFLRFPRRRHPA